MWSDIWLEPKELIFNAETN